MREKAVRNSTMAPNHVFRYPFSFTFLFVSLFFCFAVVLQAEGEPSFGFKRFEVNSEYFWSQISLFGDAKVGGNGSFLQITGSWNYSSGRVVYRKPIKLYEGSNNPRRKASFGTYFAFSLSSENGDGLAFQLLRNGLDSEFSVEFDTKPDPIYGDLNVNHVGINVGNRMPNKVINVSDVKLNSGKKLQCWIDYEVTSKRIEVRISRWGKERPVSPMISRPVDLSEMFKNEQVFIGLSSSSANTTQVCKLYSWSFKLRQVPAWMHSQPLDPDGYKKEAMSVVMHKRSHCVLRVVTALVFGTGCGALGALIVLCAWSVIAAKKAVSPEEYVVQQPVVFDYDKVKVIVIDKSDSSRK